MILFMFASFGTYDICHAGASLVKPLPVSLTDQSVTGPDLFSKLVPMATHEASSLYRSAGASVSCFTYICYLNV